MTISHLITFALITILVVTTTITVVSGYYQAKARRMIDYFHGAATVYERDAKATTNKVEHAHLLGLSSGYRIAAIEANTFIRGGPSAAEHKNGLHAPVMVGNEPCACHAGVNEQEALEVLRMVHAVRTNNDCGCVHCQPAKRAEDGPIPTVPEKTVS